MVIVTFFPSRRDKGLRGKIQLKNMTYGVKMDGDGGCERYGVSTPVRVVIGDGLTR